MTLCLQNLQGGKWVKGFVFDILQTDFSVVSQKIRKILRSHRLQNKKVIITQYSTNYNKNKYRKIRQLRNIEVTRRHVQTKNRQSICKYRIANSNDWFLHENVYQNRELKYNKSIEIASQVMSKLFFIVAAIICFASSQIIQTNTIQYAPAIIKPSNILSEIIQSKSQTAISSIMNPTSTIYRSSPLQITTQLFRPVTPQLHKIQSFQRTNQLLMSATPRIYKTQPFQNTIKINKSPSPNIYKIQPFQSITQSNKSPFSKIYKSQPFQINSQVIMPVARRVYQTQLFQNRRLLFHF